MFDFFLKKPNFVNEENHISSSENFLAIKLASNMEAIDCEILSWEEIKSRYPDEWVVLGDPVFEGTRVTNGVVLSHHSDKRVASMEGGERREGFKTFTLTFTGQHTIRQIGILRTLGKAK